MIQQFNGPLELTLWTDTREIQPLVFPQSIRWMGKFGGPVDVVLSRARTALRLTPPGVKPRSIDYTLLPKGVAYVPGMRLRTGIERKKNMREVETNVWTDDRVRFGEELQLLGSLASSPILALEFPYSSIGYHLDGYDIYQELLSMAVANRVQVLHLPKRPAAQQLLLRMALACYIHGATT